jgi:hypothetical protein
MEIHKTKDGSSIIGHTGPNCKCNPVKNIQSDGKNRGRFATVYYIHN